LEIHSKNVGKISERIVMNELEQRGYSVTDLNKDRVSANADLVAFKDGRSWQLQVKGTTAIEPPPWGLQFGYTEDAVTAGSLPMYNRKAGPYIADYIILVSVRSASDYRCFVLPVKTAERLAQNLIDLDYRVKTRDGKIKVSSKVYILVDGRPKERPETTKRYAAVRHALLSHEGSNEKAWDL
jgi:hypothetical protein